MWPVASAANNLPGGLPKFRVVGTARPQLHAAMPCHLVDGVAQLSAVDGVAPGEQVHVGEVAPPGVHHSPGDSGHDLFGVDHGERVAPRGDLPAQQPRNADLLGWRDDRVASADVDVNVSAGRSRAVLSSSPGPPGQNG